MSMLRRADRAVLAAADWTVGLLWWRLGVSKRIALRVLAVFCFLATQMGVFAFRHQPDYFGSVLTLVLCVSRTFGGMYTNEMQRAFRENWMGGLKRALTFSLIPVLLALWAGQPFRVWALMFLGGCFLVAYWWLDDGVLPPEPKRRREVKAVKLAWEPTA